MTNPHCAKYPHWHCHVVDKIGTEFGGAPYEYDEDYTVGHTAMEALVLADGYWYRDPPFLCDDGDLPHDYLECTFVDVDEEEWLAECAAIWCRND